MALSLVLHGLAVLPLFLLAGTLGSTSSQEPALLLEFSVAAPTAGADTEPDAAIAEPPPPDEPPAATPVETAAKPPEPEAAPAPAPEVVPEITVDLPPPDEPPPLKATDLKPVEPPKPKLPSPKPVTPRPATKSAPAAQAATSPDTGNAAVTQQATATPAESIVWEGKPRYRLPPKPAVYPARAIELGQQGEVLVRVRLDPDGSAAEIRLWRGSGFDLLDRAALAAVRGWHFLPATRGGHAVAAWVEIPIRFHLH